MGASVDVALNWPLSGRALSVRLSEDCCRNCWRGNGFGNETRRNGCDGVGWGATAETSELPWPARLRLRNPLETATGSLITQRSQVQILSPLPVETAPGDVSGGRFHAVWERVGNISFAHHLSMAGRAVAGGGFHARRPGSLDRDTAAPVSVGLPVAFLSPLRVAFGGAVAMLVAYRFGQIGGPTL